MGISGPRLMRLRFNGATAIEPWNYHEYRNIAAHGPRFNGATAIEPWNWLGQGLNDRADLDASMGPRQLSRGILTPTALRCPVVALQWGHGN